MCVPPACVHVHKYFIKADVVSAPTLPLVVLGGLHVPGPGPARLLRPGRAGLTLFQRQTMNITEYFCLMSVLVSEL